MAPGSQLCSQALLVRNMREKASNMAAATVTFRGWLMAVPAVTNWRRGLVASMAILPHFSLSHPLAFVDGWVTMATDFWLPRAYSEDP